MFKRIKLFLFRNISTRQTIAKNTLWLFGGEVGGRILKVALIVIAARILGTESWGIFAYVLAIVGLMTTFSDVSFSAILTRETVQRPEEKEKFISTTFFIKLAIILIGTTFIILSAGHLTKLAAARPILPIVALLLIFDGLREFGFSINRAFEKMEWEAVIKFITGAAQAILGIGALIISPSPISLAIAYVADRKSVV